MKDPNQVYGLLRRAANQQPGDGRALQHNIGVKNMSALRAAKQLNSNGSGTAHGHRSEQKVLRALSSI
jgi:hypothetical protein